MKMVWIAQIQTMACFTRPCRRCNICVCRAQRAVQGTLRSDRSETKGKTMGEKASGIERTEKPTKGLGGAKSPAQKRENMKGVPLVGNLEAENSDRDQQ